MIRIAIIQFLIFQAVYWLLTFLPSLTKFLPSSINWPISLGWAAMAIWPLCYTAKKLALKLNINWFRFGIKALRFKIPYPVLRIKNPQPFIAGLLCFSVYVAGFFLHYTADVLGNSKGCDIWITTFLYFLLSCSCLFLDRYKLATIGALATIFGVVVSITQGQYLVEPVHDPVRLVLNVLTAFMWLPLLEGRATNEPRTPKEEDPPYKREFQKAA